MLENEKKNPHSSFSPQVMCQVCLNEKEKHVRSEKRKIPSWKSWLGEMYMNKWSRFID